MYKHPLTFIFIAQLTIFFRPQHELQPWGTAAALAVVSVCYLVLYDALTVAQSAKDKRPAESDCIEFISMVLSTVWWLFLVFELEYLIVESALITITLCKKLVTVITAAVLTTAKLAYRKSRAAAYMPLQTVVKHTLRLLSRSEFAYIHNMMTMCRRCRKSIATAVNIPCGHTFLCWSCATQYRDVHGAICNSCHEDSTLVKQRQQQMCVICQEDVSGHVLFHMQQCGHQVYTVMHTNALD
jgi:hypothetical protein